MNVGIVANREASARANYRRLQNALTAEKTITLPPGTIYVAPDADGPLLTPAKVAAAHFDPPSNGREVGGKE